MAPPKAFMSYSWDSDAHKDWVRDLAQRLRGDGVDAILDSWEVVPGDQLPEFMERSVRESDFVLIVCTPNYKRRSDRRTGGVGYEGDIMTAEVVTRQNHRKFIPILRAGKWEDAAPSWLSGKYYVNLSGSPFGEADYKDLLTTLFGRRNTAPPVANKATGPSEKLNVTFLGGGSIDDDEAPDPQQFEPIKILGIVVDEVGAPRNDGTQGSALYDVPFQLTREPPFEWDEFFTLSWNNPPRFTTMHRPGIASVAGDRIILDGTTVEEVELYHRDTLVLAVDEANEKYREYLIRRQRETQTARERRASHRDTVASIAKKIRFD